MSKLPASTLLNLFAQINHLITRGLEELCLERLTIHTQSCAEGLRNALSHDTWKLKSLELVQMFSKSKHAASGLAIDTGRSRDLSSLLNVKVCDEDFKDKVILEILLKLSN